MPDNLSGTHRGFNVSESCGVRSRIGCQQDEVSEFTDLQGAFVFQIAEACGWRYGQHAENFIEVTPQCWSAVNSSAVE